LALLAGQSVGSNLLDEGLVTGELLLME
jgi:hypothetical protein